VESYGQFCPVAQTLEIVGERWTLLVVRELLEGSTRFNDLSRGVPTMSRSLLAKRLKSLTNNGIVERRLAEGGVPSYHLTAAGHELLAVVEAAGIWGQRWARRRIEVEHLDAGLLMWDIRRNIGTDHLPTQRTLVEFDLLGAPPGQGSYWLNINSPEIDLCLVHPGFGVDLTVSADLEALTRVWMGDVTWNAAVRDGSIRLKGPAALRKAFPGWLKLSPFAGVPRPDDTEAVAKS
jgi:DNA-binding HxlR family transcriptional regulator